MDWLRSRWRFDNFFTMDGIGRGGGLGLMWSNETQVEVRSYSKYHIEVVIGEVNDDKRWRFTGFYGEPDTNKRHDSWDILHFLKDSCCLPWLCAGDFNELLSNDEKLGGAVRP